MIKTSIRFFDNVPVRSVWDEESSRWWLCAVDIIQEIRVRLKERRQCGSASGKSAVQTPCSCGSRSGIHNCLFSLVTPLSKSVTAPYITVTKPTAIKIVSKVA